jgi:tetratricopeptide (TPR) repeat protein
VLDTHLGRYVTQDDELRDTPADPAAFDRLVTGLRADLAAAREHGDSAAVRERLGRLGDALRVRARSGDGYEEPVALLTEALRMSQESADAPGVVANRIRLAEALRDAGRPDTAEPLLRAALSLAGAECPEYLEHAWYALGTCQLTLGDPAGAIRSFQVAVSLCRGRSAGPLVGIAERALSLARDVQTRSA